MRGSLARQRARWLGCYRGRVSESANFSADFSAQDARGQGRGTRTMRVSVCRCAQDARIGDLAVAFGTRRSRVRIPPPRLCKRKPRAPLASRGFRVSRQIV